MLLYGRWQYNSRDDVVQEILSASGLRNWPKNEHDFFRYFNSGVLLASKSHKSALERFDPVMAAKIKNFSHFYDQNYINFLVQSQDVPFQSLTAQFNCMNLILSDFRQRYSADFIHYAGTGFVSNQSKSSYSDIIRLRDMQIICDYATLYGKRLSFYYLGVRCQMWFLDKKLSIEDYLQKLPGFLVSSKLYLNKVVTAPKYLLKRLYRRIRPRSIQDAYKLKHSVQTDRVIAILSQFNGQEISGKLFELDSSKHLPQFTAIEKQYSRGNIGVDIVAKSDSEDWLVDIKLGPPHSSHLDALKQKWQAYGNSQCWLITLSENRVHQNTAKQLGILYSSTKEIEQLENFLQKNKPPQTQTFLI